MDPTALRETLFSPTVIWTVTVGTLVMAAASVAAVPLLVVRLPADYFVRPRPPLWARLRLASPGRAALLLLKNLLGGVLLLLGLAMLVLPGQGLLTLLLALALLDVPGKHGLEQRLIRRPTVGRALAALRRRFDRPPFEMPPPVRASMPDDESRHH